MSEVEETIRVVIADDHPATREGIRTILDAAPDIEVVGEAEDGEGGAGKGRGAAARYPAAGFGDAGPAPGGFQAWVRERYPETTTLVLTAHDRDAYLAEVVKAGAAMLSHQGRRPPTADHSHPLCRAGRGAVDAGAAGADPGLGRGCGRALGAAVGARTRSPRPAGRGKDHGENCGSLAHHRKHRAYPRREPVGQTGGGSGRQPSPGPGSTAFSKMRPTPKAPDKRFWSERPEKNGRSGDDKPPNVC